MTAKFAKEEPQRSLKKFKISHYLEVVSIVTSTCPRCSHTITEEADVNFKNEFDREDDGRWIAELPSVLAYGATKEQAEAAVEALALLES